MRNKLNYINITISKSIWFAFLCILVQSSINAQITSNINRFYMLVDSASNLLVRDLQETKSVNLELNLGTEYSILANQVRGNLIKNGIEILPSNSLSGNVVTTSITIDNCSVFYGEQNSDGLFGDYFTERTLHLSGNYYISSNQSVQKFNLTAIDTINVEEVENIEDQSYLFTQGKLPPEPFFSSVLEPIVAITASAVVIILFFSIRSK